MYDGDRDRETAEKMTTVTKRERLKEAGTEKSPVPVVGSGWDFVPLCPAFYSVATAFIRIGPLPPQQC